jgi:fatty acid desaturase
MTAGSTPLFKHSEDKLPVALIVAFSVMDFAAYLLVDDVWFLAGYWLLLTIPKGIISAWGHHHQHLHTFRYTPLNRAYELLLAFHTGMTTNLWVLHHNLGHHVNFLDQTKDESRWMRANGKTMGVLEYTALTAATSYYRGYQVGKRHKKHQRAFVTWALVTFALVALFVAYRPLPGLFLFVLPMVTSLLFTSWVTYDHHSELHTESPFEASHNILNPTFNWLTGNLGYHTAHHHRQAVHWSKLPDLHASIASKIPAHLFRRSTFDFFFPSAPARPVLPLGAAGGAASEEA